MKGWKTIVMNILLSMPLFLDWFETYFVDLDIVVYGLIIALANFALRFFTEGESAITAALSNAGASVPKVSFLQNAGVWVLNALMALPPLIDLLLDTQILSLSPDTYALIIAGINLVARILSGEAEPTSVALSKK